MALAIVACPVMLCLTPALRAAAPAAAAFRAPEAVPKTGIGFRGDGTGVFPDAKPPTQWDEASGRNILWKAPVPNWCLGCPTPVGNRVLVMSEPSWQPGSVWPELVCYDADTGALLWRRAVDPFLAFPEVAAEQRQRMTEDVAWSHDLWRRAYLASAAIAAKGGAGADSPEIKKANEALAAHGMTLEGVRMNYGQLRALRFSDENSKRFKEIDQRLRPYGVVRYNTWDNNQRCRVGTCFPTPVSDGQRVYVMTVHGTVACYDMEGNLVWCRSSGRWVTGTHALMESPRLFGDLLLTQFKGSYADGTKESRPRLFAWDKKTGEKRWAVDLPNGSAVKGASWGSRPGASPTIMHLGRTPVVLTSSGNVVRLPDGKVYDAKIGQTLATWGIDDEHDAIFSDCSYDGAQPRFGLELALMNDDLQVKVRWIVGPPGSKGGPCMVYHQGRLFWSGVQLGPATGLALGAKDETADLRRLPRTSPESRHPILVANVHVYGVREERPKDSAKPCQAVCEVFTLDGKKVAANILLAKSRTDAELNDKWLGQGFERSSFSYGCPFSIGGDRVYVRSEDYLYCVGTK
jgi:hypothetical protein